MSKSHDTKGNLTARAILSFILSVLIVLLSLAICSKACFTNASYVEKKLTSYEYVSSLRDDALEYAEDLFIKNGIPNGNLGEVITYEKIYTISEAYINSILKVKTGFTQETVTGDISDLSAEITGEIKTQLARTDYEYNEAAAQKISARIGSYINNRLTIPGTEYIETVTNIGPVASVVLTVVLAVFTVMLAIIIFFIGAKRYRSVRAVGISFMTAGFYDLILSLIVIIISGVKQVDIYPLYLRDAFMSYVYGCVGAVALSGAILLLISLAFISAVWKMKRNEK